jgi:hypothetical protein
MRLLSDDPTQRPTASEARDGLAAIAEGRAPGGGTPATGTAVLDVNSVAAAGAGRAAVTDPAPDQVDTAAVVPPVPPRPAAPGTGGGDDGTAADRRRPLLIALAAVLVVGLGVLVAVLTRGTDAGSGSQTPTTSAAAAPAPARSVAPTTGAVPTTSAAPTTSTEPSTTSETTTTETTESVPVTDPVGFVQSFYGQLPGNTDAAWALLGTTAQDQSGGRSSFDSFYGGLSRVWAENLRASGNTVTATIVFTSKSGSVSRENYQFVVGSQNGRQVIESFSH